MRLLVVVVGSVLLCAASAAAQAPASANDELDWGVVETTPMPAWPPKKQTSSTPTAERSAPQKKAPFSTEDELSWDKVEHIELGALPWPPRRQTSSTNAFSWAPLSPAHNPDEELSWEQLDDAFGEAAPDVPSASTSGATGQHDEPDDWMTSLSRVMNRVSVLSWTQVALHLDNKNEQDDDDDFVRGQERLYVRGEAGAFTTSARVALDGFVFPKDEKVFDGSERNMLNNTRLERLKLSWSDHGFTVDIGDYYQQLGRGMALNLRKPIAAAGIDVALRGARASFSSSMHDVEAFAGFTNADNIDPVRYRRVEDPNDFLVGGQYELRPLDEVRVGAYGLFNMPQERVLRDEVDMSGTAGAFAHATSWLVDDLSVYLEGAAQLRTLVGELQQGYALTGVADYRLGDVTVLAEGLFLSGFSQRGSTNTALGRRFDYNQPSTLERLDQQVLDTYDVVGGRGRVEYFLEPLALLVYGNLMVKRNRPFSEEPVDQIHVFTGLQWTPLDERVFAAIGIRDEGSGGWVIPAERLQSMVHLDLDWLHPLGDGFQVHAVTNTQVWQLGEQIWMQGSTFLGVERAGQWGLTYELGVDGRNQSIDIQNTFHALIASVDVIHNTRLRATVGSQRGGIKCVAGVCREFPSFAGGQLEVVTRF